MTDFPPIRKAVFPVAGLGTRFLPATKSIPKEMLPIVDKPLIQYAVDEAVEAGVDTIIFVTSHKKGAILDHLIPMRSWRPCYRQKVMKSFVHVYTISSRTTFQHAT